MLNLRKIGWTGCVEYMKEVRNAYRVLTDKPEMKRLMDVDWINLAWQAAVDTVTASWIPQKSAS
jgi:hypothetical protein